MEIYKVRHVLWSIFVILFCFQIATIVQTDKYTSMVDIKSLLSTEKEFETFLDSYLQSEEERLKTIEEAMLEIGESSFSNLNAEEISNPLNAYRLMSELHNKEDLLHQLMENTSMADLLFVYNENGVKMSFPDYLDLQGVIDALDRVIRTYDLNISSVTRGQIYPGANKVKQFSGDDCFEVGVYLYASKKFSKAIPWFKEALSRELLELKTTSKATILEFLANSTYLASIDDSYNLTRINLENKSKEIGVKLQILDTEKKENNFEIFQTKLDNIKAFMENVNIKILDKSFLDIDENWEQNNQLCRHEQPKNFKKETKLKCYYSNKASKYLTIQPIKIEDIHLKPSILIYHDILNDREIEIIKKLSLPGLKRAQVGSGGTVDYRISQSAWLDDEDHNVVDHLSKRLHEITRLDLKKAAEALQIVNYGIGGHYEIHCDFDYRLKKGTSNKENPLGNRIATVLIYLSDVRAGGSTIFPQLNIAMRPQKGSAIFWYNLYKSGDSADETGHAACPVLMGSKWVANKWILEHHQEFLRPCGLTENDY